MSFANRSSDGRFERGIDKAVAAVVAQIRKVATEVTGREEIVQVGTISANNDSPIDELIADATRRRSVLN